MEKIKGEEPWRNLRLFIFIIEWRTLMRRIRIKCHYCGEYGSFISEERVEVIPEVNASAQIKMASVTGNIKIAAHAAAKPVAAMLCNDTLPVEVKPLKRVEGAFRLGR